MARKKAWVYQVASQVAKHGTDKAAWCVGWIDPDGRRKTKSCGPGRGGLSAAKALADKTHAQIVTGTYQERSKATWEDFMERYTSNVLAGMDALSRGAAVSSLEIFQRVAKPARMAGINTDAVDDFIAKRRAETFDKTKRNPKGSKLPSPATINRDLRYLRAALRTARDWKYLTTVPKFKFLKVPDKLPTYCPPEHFAAIYSACDAATLPANIPNVSAADWWRALLVTAYMTGWRISQILALQWTDVNLEKETALSRAEDNKGRRDTLVPLHSTIVDHLRKLAGSFDQRVFPWADIRRLLWDQFGRIQAAAVIPTEAGNVPLPKGGKGGRRYGFHDLRRGFATLNASEMDLFELQALMQHRDLATTQIYVNMAKRLNTAVGNLYVPDVLRRAGAS